MATDYLLGGLALVLASRLFAEYRSVSQKAVVLWAGALLAVSLASFAGGTYHGFGHAMSERATVAVWTLTSMSMGLASFFLLAAALSASFGGEIRSRLIAGAAVKLAIYLVWVSAHDEFVWVILDYGSTLLIVLLLAAIGRLQGLRGHRSLIVSGILVSIAAAIVQQSGIRLHRHFNHNDFMHVIQMGGVWLLFKGGRRLRDAEVPHVSQS
jgi:hypothetical protein